MIIMMGGYRYLKKKKNDVAVWTPTRIRKQSPTRCPLRRLQEKCSPGTARQIEPRAETKRDTFCRKYLGGSIRSCFSRMAPDQPSAGAPGSVTAAITPVTHLDPIAEASHWRLLLVLMFILLHLPRSVGC